MATTTATPTVALALSSSPSSVLQLHPAFASLLPTLQHKGPILTNDALSNYTNGNIPLPGSSQVQIQPLPSQQQQQQLKTVDFDPSENRMDGNGEKPMEDSSAAAVPQATNPRSKLIRLSLEERMQVIISVSTGHSQRRVAETHGVAPSTIATIMKRYKEEKRISLKPPPGRKRISMSAEVTQFIVNRQAENPLMTAADIVDDLRREKNIVLRRQRISEIRKEHGLVKKHQSKLRKPTKK